MRFTAAFLITAALLAGAPSTASAQSDSNTWLASIYAGANFESNAPGSSSSADFGVQLAYRYRGYVGLEMLLDWDPSFKMSNAFLADNPSVDSYMFNLLTAIPIGSDTQFHPYLSGGIGGIRLKSDVFSSVSVNPLNSSTPTTVTTGSGNETRFGGDIGGGIIAFAGKFGIRGDVRYYKAATTGDFSSTDPVAIVTKGLISGLNYWRANAGLSVRW